MQKSHQGPGSEFGPLSLAEHLVGFEPGTFQILVVTP